MGLLPRQCEPFTARQKSSLAVIAGLLRGAARALSPMGRSLDRSAESFAIRITLSLLEQFNGIRADRASRRQGTGLTGRQRRVIRAVRLAVGFAGEGFRRWWELEPMNRQHPRDFPWFTQPDVGLRLYLAAAILERAFPDSASRRRMRSADALCTLCAVDGQLKGWRLK